MRVNFLSLWSMVIPSTLLLSTCTLNQVTLTPQPTSAFGSALAQSPLPTYTSVRTQTPTPTPVSFSPDAYPGWHKYRNGKFGFSIRYPSDWTWREILGVQNTMSGHAVHFAPRSTDLVRLVVGFKGATEDAQITRTGIGSGDIVRRGFVVFLGQPINRDILILKGKDLAILYQGSGEVRRGDLIFTLSFDYRGSPTDKGGLTVKMESTADKIVSSFELNL
jgi:hypothetical protein